MNLGAFSVSLSVKDISASHEFYEKLGFSVIGGKEEENWLILRSGETTIGLFKGMFDKNTLTFNPGWDAQSQPLEDFDDVRKVQSALKERGLTLTQEVGGESDGPAYISLIDPDGNPILIDQHV